MTYSMYEIGTELYSTIGFDLIMDYNRIAIKTSILKDDAEYKSWYNTHVDTGIGILGISNYKLLFKVAKIAKQINELIYVNPLTIMEVIEKN